ncbi:FidL-like protein [Serratia fonticola]|uniref:FidL-like protein n=1 Tax=Serratia fonticola TaxID=47917 RepID=UPI003BB60BE0
MILRWSILLLLCFSATVVVLHWNPSCKLKISSLSCRAQSKFIFSAGPQPPTFSGTLALRFNNDGNGIIGLAGILSIGENHYKVLRTATMHYTVVDAEHGWFNVRPVKDAVRKNDNAPDEVVDTYLLGNADKKEPRIFHVWPLNDKAYLIGNMYSPLMVCSRRND